ncbi:Nitronate monooxygenase [Providencia rustigianii]|uniref:Nitronate monooxygenase n=2 Tax=Providencia rustigianii TaxID=158850 RepID=D1P0M2_9GAMM|nr:nitronate monooxygenase [Providencia rustigianii]EFB72891.1 oxidoreductase, 2-nitropropane dioxygenase family protein [Providencia rustigianii DSM 4541]SPY76223.1 Nitronate monooxygenase [Providencia rustigianii]SUC25396.1 Nitronate monooxygenase [Providencia rustigianii]SUC34191.1 Nitronate monooxygenase [Providencia rustigianii]VEB63256.1 Nitronate monooxygenase [Providencia rustigianii]
MSNSDRFMRRLGLRYPIIQAPMAGVSTPSLAAAVSEAGGLGSLGLGASTVEQARTMMTATKALTDQPFNVNVFCHRPPQRNDQNEHAWIECLTPLFQQFNAIPPEQLNEIYLSFLDNPEMLQLLLDMKPAVVSFHFNIPSPEIVKALQGRGIYTMATATNLHEARQIELAGIDAIVAQGIEAGGHRGMFDVQAIDQELTTNQLVIQLVKQTQLPIIAAGGVMNGEDINDALANGAAAAQLGTAFLLCPESAATEGYRRKLKSQTSDNTVLTTAISGRPARGILNPLIQLAEQYGTDKLPDYPVAYDVAKQLHGAALKCGNDGFAAYWAGQKVARSREMSAKTLMETLIKEMS